MTAKTKTKTKIIDRVQALLAKAESTTFEAEAAALYEKAQDLMMKHAIEQAELMLAGAATSDAIINAFWVFSRDDKFRPGKLELLGTVCKNNRVKMVFFPGSKTVQQCGLVGLESDVEYVKMLYTSLLLFGLKESAKAFKTDNVFGATKHRWTSSFLTTYAMRISGRFDAQRKAAEAATPGDSLPALYDAVAAAVKDFYPGAKTKRARRVKGVAGASEAAGKAASKADLSGGRNTVQKGGSIELG